MTAIQFTARQFTATDFDSAADKAEFCRQFVTFVEGGYRLVDFPERFYRRLSMTFGHIAHYDRPGFYDYFFMSDNGRVRFIQQCEQYHAAGDPKFTYSDAEKAIQKWLRDGDWLGRTVKALVDHAEAQERQELIRLVAKYGCPVCRNQKS